MNARTTVKEYQIRLAQLDADHSRAQDRLAAARRKRDEVVAAQDRLVTAAECQVQAAIATMAAEVGPYVTAALLDLDRAGVRRLVKSRRQSDVDARAAGAFTRLEPEAAQVPGGRLVGGAVNRPANRTPRAGAEPPGDGSAGR